MEWLWLVFGVLAAFAMLSLISSERQRLLDDQAKSQPAPVEPAPDAPPQDPIQPIG